MLPPYGATAYGAAAPPHAKHFDFGEWTATVRGLWPSIYLLMVCAFFAPPLTILANLAQDASAKYWIGASINAALFVQALIFIAFLLHGAAGRARFYPTLCSTVVPAILIILIGVSTAKTGNNLAVELRSKDCQSYPTKLHVEMAYRSAAQIFDGCVQRVANSMNQTANHTVYAVDIEDCSEFMAMSPERVRYQEEWQYLEDLEREEGCSGWCTPGEPTLFVRQHYTSDLCAYAAAQVMGGKVARMGTNLVLAGAVELFFSMFLMSTIGSYMEKNGDEW